VGEQEKENIETEEAAPEKGEKRRNISHPSPAGGRTEEAERVPCREDKGGGGKL